MIDLAMQHGTGPVTLAEISQRQKISLVLSRAAVREAAPPRARRQRARTRAAATRLAKDMAEVSVADIILAVDEPIDATQCGGKENCRDDQKCITHDLWAKLNDHILDYLRGVTLKQTGRRQKAKATGVAQVQDMRETLNKRDRTTGFRLIPGTRRPWRSHSLKARRSTSGPSSRSAARVSVCASGSRKSAAPGFAYTFDFADEAARGRFGIRVARRDRRRGRGQPAVPRRNAARFRQGRVEADVHVRQPQRRQHRAAAARASA
mgnify:CR=1 FL=1